MMLGSSHFPALAASLMAFIAVVPRAVSAGEWPSLQVDPDTISPCVMWEDNANDLVCEDVREFWNITAEEFSRWNPSVGLNCKPWRVQSYCVVPLERLPTTTSSSSDASETATATSTSSASSTLGPSPTSWSALGCYTDENSKYSALERRVSGEGGDDQLTISACQDACYRAAFLFTGVKAGRECWCGDAVLGDLAASANDCDTPCSGDESETCGGSKSLNVFEPVDSFWDENPTETETQTVSRLATTVADADSSAWLHGSGQYMYTLMLTLVGCLQLSVLL